MQQLLEIQDLELTLAETDILHRDKPDRYVRQVQDEVETKRRNVDRHILRRFDQLRRNGTAVVKEESGVCNGCRLNIPIGDLRRMQHGDIPWVCPNCSRFILLSH